MGTVARVGALLVGLVLAPSAAAQGIECLDPGNRLINCGFDTSITGWFVNLSGLGGTVAHQPGDGFPQPGSLQGLSQGQPFNNQLMFIQDLAPLALQAPAYEVGIDVRLISGPTPDCFFGLHTDGGQNAYIAFTPGSQWQRVGGQLAIPVPEYLSWITVSCSHSTLSTAFVMRFDDAYLSPTGNATDISVELSSCTSSVELGGGVAYSAVVRNLDAFFAADVDMAASLPATCTWTCLPGSGAFCSPGPVTGPLNDALALPPLGSAAYEIACRGVTGGSATVTATTVGGADPQPSNNVASVNHTVVAAGAGPYVKGDLTGDTHPDLVLRQQTNWDHAVWEQVGSRRLGSGTSISPTPDAASFLAGVDDFDGDHRSDLVFRDPATNAVEIWLMNGLIRSGSPVPVTGAPQLSSDWRLPATGDFNADGRPDLLWRNSTTQKLAVWTMNGASYIGTLLPTPDQAADANWEVVAALDYDGDGHRDLLWYNSTSGKLVQWLLDASLVRLTGRFTAPANAGDNNWKVFASGNFGAGPGGQACANDVVWRNANSGKLVLWYLDQAGARTAGTFTTPAAPSPSPLSWALVGPR